MPFDLPPAQQLHPGACFLTGSVCDANRGSWRARSLVLCAWRSAAGMRAKLGGVIHARGAGVRQSGHGCGRLLSAIGHIAVNTPQSVQ